MRYKAIGCEPIKDCFAYDSENHTCRALKELYCANICDCQFYKPKTAECNYEVIEKAILRYIKPNKNK